MVEYKATPGEKILRGLILFQLLPLADRQLVTAVVEGVGAVALDPVGAHLVDLAQLQQRTDGACSGNPGPGGWGAILQYGEHRKELSGGDSRPPAGGFPARPWPPGPWSAHPSRGSTPRTRRGWR